jgi:chaperonin GroEL (HSP60 family)
MPELVGISMNCLKPAGAGGITTSPVTNVRMNLTNSPLSLMRPELLNITASLNTVFVMKSVSQEVEFALFLVFALIRTLL